MRRMIVASVVFALALCAGSYAAVPQVISFQGKLADSAGAASGDTVDIAFTLYDDATAGSSLWTETQSVDPNDDGLFTVLLGSVAPLSGVDFSQQLWLGVKVGTDAEMTPRFQLAAAPYALRAASAATADTATTADTLGAITEADVNAKADASELSDQNNATTPVDWADLVNIPGDIADGDQLGAAGVSSLDGVTDGGGGIDLVEGAAVTITPDDASDTIEVSVDVGTGSGQVAAGDHDHDAAYVNVGEASSITAAMIADGEALAEILDDDGPGSLLDADLLDGLNSDAFATAGHTHHSLNASDGDPVDALYVDAAGEVGIGTTSPSTKLHVIGDTRIDGAVSAYNSAIVARDAYQRIQLRDDDSSGHHITSTSRRINKKPLYVSNLYNYEAGTAAGTTSIHFRVGDAAAPDTPLVIENTGNIGVGTFTPSVNLDVRGGNLRVDGADGYNAPGEQARIYLGFMDGVEQGHAGILAECDFGLKFGVYCPGGAGSLGPNSMDAMVIEQGSGNVGIGTTVPNCALDVAGTIVSRRNDYQYVGITGIDPSGGYVSCISPGTERKTLHIDSLHDASTPASGETGIKLRVGAAASPVEAMTITQSGDVGIGTATPAARLAVDGGGIVNDGFPVITNIASTFNSVCSIPTATYEYMDIYGLEVSFNLSRPTQVMISAHGRANLYPSGGSFSYVCFHFIIDGQTDTAVDPTEIGSVSQTELCWRHTSWRLLAGGNHTVKVQWYANDMDTWLVGYPCLRVEGH